MGQKETFWLFSWLGLRTGGKDSKPKAKGSYTDTYRLCSSCKANQTVFLNATKFMEQKSSQCNAVSINLSGDLSDCETVFILTGTNFSAAP